jgi:amino acid adenylation domain-containing protein
MTRRLDDKITETAGKVTRRQGDKVTETAEACTPSPLHPFTPSELTVVDLEADWEQIAREPTTNPDSAVTPGNLAYVIYTSGSTGTPKGTLISHANAARLFAATQELFDFDAADVWTLFHSAAFDFSVWELWGALLYGGRLVVVPYWVSRAPDAFSLLLRTQHITVLNQTPSAFRQLIQADAQAKGSLDLRYVIFGGEALDISSLRPWFERHGDQSSRLVNMYGITETTVHVTFRPIELADLERTGSPIGSPLADLQAYVLDSRLEPQPSGIPGELYIGGAGLARGYLNRPDLTAERFIPNPFQKIEDRGLKIEDSHLAAHHELSSILYPPSSTRLYRTGDRVRFREDGQLEFLGRLDHQIKLRGFRIELGEIEVTLAQHPAVRQAVVTLHATPSGDGRLIAYIVPTAEDGGW